MPVPQSNVLIFSNNQQLSFAANPDQNGNWTYNTTALPVGTDAITAQYVGDGNFNPGTSGPVTEQVNPIPQKQNVIVTITSITPNPAQVGQTVTITGTVVPA